MKYMTQILPKTNRKSGSALTGLLGLALLSTMAPAQANTLDEAMAACTEAVRLIEKEDDLNGAIEEASWCLTGLKQLKDEIKLSIMPDDLDGFIGGEIENENVLGVNSISRVYTQDTDSLTISLVTQGAASDNPLAGLGELGKLFGAMEGASVAAGGGKKIRIQRRTAIVSEDLGSATVSIELKSGASLRAESSDLDSDELVDFMKEFPVAEIDDATAE